MATQEDILGLIYASREIRRAPMVRVELLHQRPVGLNNRLARRALLKSKNLIGQIFGHRPIGAAFFAPSRARVGVSLSCRTPAGKPAVEISFK